MSLQQHYVETFDLDKRSGLYLTFYGQGDKRERGHGAACGSNASTGQPGSRCKPASCPTSCR